MARKPRILIADDDRVVVALVSEFLRKKDFDVVLAFDAMQTMMGVRNAALSAIIVDLGMPGGGGLDVIRKIRMNTKTLTLPIVVLTASTDPKVESEARALGADEFLTKPVNVELLHAALLRALGAAEQHPVSN